MFAQHASTIAAIKTFTDKQYPSLQMLYEGLHQHPELSLQEVKTSMTMAAELKKLGFTVVEKIGGYGVAGVLKNGNGPTLVIRTDMDALPLEEKTGLPYASKAKGVNAVGDEVSVMHACGHDVHMTVFIGTARALVDTKANWKGTLVMVAQPSEENGFGASMMFKDNLYDKIPYPDFAIALHNHAGMAAGTIGYSTGPFMASVDMMNITVHGKGGHGATPHLTIDPIVLSAQMIMAFQTIESREIDPLQPAVITVGSIHGGTVHNIIPDQVKMQLTLRSYSPEVRKHIIASIENKSKQLARQAGLTEDKMPEITINQPDIAATINDKVLTERLMKAFANSIGENNVMAMPPSMVGEDFNHFGSQNKKIPICMFWLGTVDASLFRTAKESHTQLPSLHSPSFAPAPEPSIKTGIVAMSTAALELLKAR
jgi:hippurate hydrolase